MALQFLEFPKIARLNREVIVTEKIDGTNAGIHITRATGIPEDYESVLIAVPEAHVYPESGEMNRGLFLVRASSRNGYINRGPSDNCGFAEWVYANAQELCSLGVGSHFGEWWGSGIQRKYGLTGDDKRFSLFNVGRWRPSGWPADLTQPKQMEAPKCCCVVPVLTSGIALGKTVEDALRMLREQGSYAAPGFMKPEGVVAFHTASRQLYKVTLERDEEPKGKAS